MATAYDVVTGAGAAPRLRLVQGATFGSACAAGIFFVLFVALGDLVDLPWLSDLSPAAQGGVGVAGYLLICLVYGVGTPLLCGRAILSDTDFQNSFYFIGFILTLSALAASVVGVALSGTVADAGARDQLVNSLMTENAIAVASTVLGLIIRNILLYVFGDGSVLAAAQPAATRPGDWETELAAAERRMSAFVDAFTGLADSVSAKAVAIEASGKRFAGAMSDVEGAADKGLTLHDRFNAALTRIRDSFETLETKLVAVEARLEKIAKEARENIDQVALGAETAQQNMQAALEDVSAGAGVLRSAVSELPKAIAEGLKDSMSAPTEAIDALKAEAATQQTAYLATLDALSTAMAETTDRYRAAAAARDEDLGKTIESASVLTGDLREMQQRIVARFAEMKDLLDGVPKLAEAVSVMSRRIVQDDPDPEPNSSAGHGRERKG